MKPVCSHSGTSSKMSSKPQRSRCLPALRRHVKAVQGLVRGSSSPIIEQHVTKTARSILSLCSGEDIELISTGSTPAFITAAVVSDHFANPFHHHARRPSNTAIPDAIVVSRPAAEGVLEVKAVLEVTPQRSQRRRHNIGCDAFARQHRAAINEEALRLKARNKYSLLGLQTLQKKVAWRKYRALDQQEKQGYILEGSIRNSRRRSSKPFSLINFHLQLKVTTEERWAQAKHSPAAGTTYMLWDEIVPRQFCAFRPES